MAYYTQNGLHYGLAVEEINFRYGISRLEQGDYSEYAFTRRQVAIKTGHTDKEIVKTDTLNHDELCIYPENLSISPLFYSSGSVTSFCTALPSDGAVALQVASEDIVEKFQLNWLASVISYNRSRSHPVLFPQILEEHIKALLDSQGLNKSIIGL